MTPERLDTLIRLHEMMSNTDHVHRDTLAALRAYRELLQAFGLRQRASAPTEAQETRSAESKAECPECFGEGAIPMSNGYERRTCGYCKGFGVIDVHP